MFDNNLYDSLYPGVGIPVWIWFYISISVGIATLAALVVEAFLLIYYVGSALTQRLREYS